jgi:hypothetical protein
MIRISVLPLWRRLAVAATVAASFGVLTGCDVGVGADYPSGYYGGYYDDYPPDAYIATTAPVYYDGYPTYWYHGRWFYRNGGGWAHYDHEPRALYGRRIAAPPVRRNYEPAFHGGARGGAHFGGHAGGHGRR